MTASPDDLRIEATDGRIRFRLVDGTVLGEGPEAEVAPAFEEALAHLSEPRGVVEGIAVRGVCTFDQTDTDLVAGRTDEGVALIWRDAKGSVVGRVDVPAETAEAFVVWLQTLDVAPAMPPERRARRAALLDAMGDVTAARRRAEAREAGTDEIHSLTASIADLRRRYVDDLPQVTIGRDPFDGSVVSAALDDGGLDGPFWDAENPARPAQTMPAPFVVLTGAMRLSSLYLERTSHLCLPGPAVPFVVPDLLSRDGVKAVLASIRIGPHIGYAVSYFSPRAAEPPPLPNEWGRREYWLREGGLPVRMGSSYDTDPAPDFNLRPWIQAAKLAWVAPDDRTMRLRWALPGFPYPIMPGEHRHQRVQAGRIF